MDLLFTLALAGIFIFGLSSAQGFRRQARLFPTVIGITGILMAAAVLALDFRNRRTASRASALDGSSPVGATDAPQVGGTETPGLTPTGERNRVVAIWAWILGFVLAVWLLGFMVAVPVATFLYLRFGARESLLTSGLFALGCGAVFYAMFGQVVRIPFEQGLVFDLLGG